MAGQLDGCRFAPTAGGTSDFTFSSAVVGYQSPTAAGVVNGRLYKYRAESADLSQWEVGEGTYSSGVLSRTTVLFNSSGSTSKISFTLTPSVAIVLLKEDLLLIDEANAWSYLQKAQARANIDALKKNYLLNGGMQISQENGTAAGTTSGYFLADQWSIQTSSPGTATFSAAQVASATPGGSTHRLRVTVTAAQATVGSTLVYLQQKIEGQRVADLMWGTASAKTATFSVGFKPPVSGTYVVQATNASGASATSGLITVAAPEVGTDVSKQVTLAGMTTGTWATDNTSGISVQLFLMHPSQSANVFATNGNVCEMFDALFVEGGSAPAFVLPDFNNDIVSCKRYYEKSYDYATALGTSSANGVENMFLATTSATVLNGALTPRFKVSKRAAPTVVVYSETGAVNKIRDRQNNVDLTPGGPDLIGENGFRVYGTITAGTILVLSCHWTANARL